MASAVRWVSAGGRPEKGLRGGVVVVKDAAFPQERDNVERVMKRNRSLDEG